MIFTISPDFFTKKKYGNPGISSETTISETRKSRDLKLFLVRSGPEARSQHLVWKSWKLAVGLESQKPEPGKALSELV